LNTLTRRLSHEGWQTYLKEQGPAVPGYVYDLAQVKPLEPDELPEGAADAGLKVPLVVQGEAIGQLAVAEGAELDTDSTEIISAVAERLSAHLENLRLTEQTQAALSSTQALYDLAAQLNAAASLDHILKITATADDAAGGALYTFELDPHGRPEALVVAALWSTSSTPVQVGDRIPLSQFPSAGDWLADPETPRLVSNFATAPNLDAATAASYQQSGVKAAVFLPLAVGSRWVGLLTLAWAEPRNFSASDEQRYKAMADQAATVVNNRLLFEQEQKYAAQLARLSQMEGSLSQAQTEQDVLNAFLVNLGLPPEASLSLSYLHNNTAGQPEAYDLVEVWSNGAFRSETTEQPRNVPLAALPISPLWLEQPDEVLYIDDVTTDPRVTDAIQAQAHRQGWQSEVVIPLHSSNAWQGLLTINWPRPRVLSDEDMKLFAQLMDPLAAVVATRRAYLAQAAAQREAERRAQREQLLREITAKLAATSDMESVMRVAAQELGQALGRQTFVVLDTPESSMAAKN
jgi:GAF domain-containing protein